VKVVIAGVNAEGRSYVESSRDVTGESRVQIWNEPGLGGLHEMIARVDPDALSPELEPAAGGFKWIYKLYEPEAQQAEPPRYGMHITRTIDFDFVLSGRQQCILDEEIVELEAGDVIILKAANHQWRNTSDEPCGMFFLLHTPTQAV
jgi:hypothetical protein